MQSLSQRFIWLAGFGGERQTRFVKRFPETSGNKVEVSLDLKLGGPDVGQFIFDQVGVSRFVLYFSKWGLKVLNPDNEGFADTGIEIDGEKWNQLILCFDFEKHLVEIVLNTESIGTYPLQVSLSGFDQINFFGGGATFESALSDMSIISVDAFTEF